MTQVGPPGPQVELGPGWVDPACPLCGIRLRDRLLDGEVCPPEGEPQRVSLVCCQGCGFAYTTPRPEGELLGSFYTLDYKPHQSPPPTLLSSPNPSSGRLVAKDLRKGFPPFGEGRMLDFGCGSGSYLERMKAKGWKVTGVDASAKMAHNLSQKGWEVYPGSLPNTALHGRSFDLMTMWQSLEHVPDPVGLLRAALALLVPGGKLLIAVPALDSWNFTAFGEDWLGVDFPLHFSHFTKKSLYETALKAGVLVEDIGRLNHASWMRQSALKASVRLGKRRPLWMRLLQNKVVSRGWAFWVHHVLGRSDCLLLKGCKPKESLIGS